MIWFTSRIPYHLTKKLLQSVVRRLPILRTFSERELTTGMNVDVPLRRRLWLYRRGFTTRSDALFNLDEGNYREFVSDLQHERTDDVNDPWDAVVNNKLAFHLLFDGFSAHLPACYGILDEDIIRRTSAATTPVAWEERTAPDDEDTVERVKATAWIDRHLETTEALVLKPIYGQGGRDVLVCRRYRDGSYRVNGEAKTTAEFETLVENSKSTSSASSLNRPITPPTSTGTRPTRSGYSPSGITTVTNRSFREPTIASTPTSPLRSTTGVAAASPPNSARTGRRP